MIIDFHTHTFPDKIAAKALAALSAKGGLPPRREGTLASLKASMAKAKVDYSVVLPVATVPHQVESINRLAFQENGREGIFFAGSIHPDTENVEEVLDAVQAAGLFGIKLHPDYQETYFDDDRYIRIMESAARRGLMIVTHAGLDVGYPDDIHCPPDRVLFVLDALKGLIDDKLVLAHLGGCDMPDEVIEKLAGKPVYFDTAVVLDRYPERIRDVVRAHGADRVLFATDSPWADQLHFVELMHHFGFTESELAQMFWKNAAKLLHLDVSHINE